MNATAATGPPRNRLDRPVLVSNVVSGALWLLIPAFLGAWPLLLVGAAQVVVGSVFLAAVYAREALTRNQEALAWGAPWIVAVATWTLVGAGIGGGDPGSDQLLPLWFGLIVATPCYLGWQIVALAVRQLLAWQARPAPIRP